MFNISKLKMGEYKVDINGLFIIPDEMIDKQKIIELKPVLVDGFINENYDLNISVSGTMVLKDTRTLDNIPYEFNFQIDETLDENSKFFKNYQNELDILEILWENIVLEIPMRVVSHEDDFTLKGEGWELTDNYNKVDERLAPLSELLQKGKE